MEVAHGKKVAQGAHDMEPVAQGAYDTEFEVAQGTHDTEVEYNMKLG